MQEAEWLRIAKMLSASYSRQEITPETLAVYFVDLREFDAEKVDAACTKLRRESQWFPTIAEIRAEIRAEVGGPSDRWESDLVERLRSAFRQALPPDSARAYEAAFLDVIGDRDLATGAVDSLIASSRFLPSIAEIVDRSIDLREARWAEAKAGHSRHLHALPGGQDALPNPESAQRARQIIDELSSKLGGSS